METTLQALLAEKQSIAPTLPTTPAPKTYKVKEFRVISLREMPIPAEMVSLENPDTVANYFHQFVKNSPQFNEAVENFIVIFLNTRKRVTGHSIVSTGTLDTVLTHPREVFRAGNYQ